MWALVTGASSGIGRDISVLLSKKGYNIILVGRNKEELVNTSLLLDTNYKIYVTNLCYMDEIDVLYKKISNLKIDVVINNAGFGVYGEFCSTSEEDELSMIDVNIKGLHKLFKLFLTDFKKRDSGYILNVASTAAFQPGPLMASYYASKAYVLRLTEAVSYELKKSKSNVYIGVLCPGPVDTNFNKVAGDIEFKVRALSSEYVSMYAIKKMFKRRIVIIPGLSSKLINFFVRFLPSRLILAVAYNVQTKKK